MIKAPSKNHVDRPKRDVETAVNVALNIAIWLAWGWLSWPLADYLGTIFTRQDFRTNQILLGGIIVLLVLQSQTSWARFDPRRLPEPRRLPLLLMLSGASAYLLVEWRLDVHTLAATFLGLATYGLLGLWLAPHRWRQGIPAALLLIGTLPFGAHLQTFVGYPMRIATAALVREGLAAAGYGSLGVDTILVFENGVAHVDLPCSGVQSLWTGALFLLAASWIRRRPLNMRWGGTALAFTGLLFVANLTRVAVLVTVGEVWGARLLAEMLHVPLGVLGFAGACAAAVWLLGDTKPAHPKENRAAAQTIILNKKVSPTFPFILLATVVGLALLYTPRPLSGLAQDNGPVWAFPAGLEVESLPLKADEQAWLMRDGAEVAERYRFTWQGHSGSMILITSRTWRAHHRPERCFEVYGLKIENVQTQLVNSAHPLKVVSLSNDDPPRQYTAGYWFQSANQITDDYATRIWADLSPQRDRWVLVSFIFDEPINSNDESVIEFYRLLEEMIDREL